MKIGILALQGNYREHSNMLKDLDVETILIKQPSDLENVDGLIIPGGESTTIGILLKRYNLDKKILEKHEEGMPIFGVCAGAIILAKEIVGSEQPRLGLMDLSIKRNAYGRQIESFESEIFVNGVGNFKGIFIRAPIISEIHNGVEVMSEFNGKAIMVKNGNLLAATFHPELTDNPGVHKYFLDMVKNNSHYT